MKRGLVDGIRGERDVLESTEEIDELQVEELNVLGTDLVQDIAGGRVTSLGHYNVL